MSGDYALYVFFMLLYIFVIRFFARLIFFSCIFNLVISNLNLSGFSLYGSKIERQTSFEDDSNYHPFDTVPSSFRTSSSSPTSALKTPKFLTFQDESTQDEEDGSSIILQQPYEDAGSGDDEETFEENVKIQELIERRRKLSAAAVIREKVKLSSDPGKIRGGDNTGGGILAQLKAEREKQRAMKMQKKKEKEEEKQRAYGDSPEIALQSPRRVLQSPRERLIQQERLQAAETGGTTTSKELRAGLVGSMDIRPTGDSLRKSSYTPALDSLAKSYVQRAPRKFELKKDRADIQGGKNSIWNKSFKALYTAPNSVKKFKKLAYLAHGTPTFPSHKGKRS